MSGDEDQEKDSTGQEKQKLPDRMRLQRILTPGQEEQTHRLLGETGKRQCSAIAKNTGKQCEAPPILGGFVCRLHGGSLPQTKEKALNRLRALVDPVIDALTRVIRMADQQACEECGSIAAADPKLLAVVVKASQLVLDRAGYAPKKEVEVTHRTDVPQGWEQFLTDEQVLQVNAWIMEARVKALEAGVQLLEQRGPIDVEAEVVPDE